MTDRSVGDVDLSLEVVKGVSAKFTQGILGFAGAILFARILGPTSFGGFYLLMSLVRIVDWPTRGWATASKKRYSEAAAPKEEIFGAQILVNVLLIAIITIFVVTFDGWLVSYTGVKSAPSLFLMMFIALVFFYPFQQLLTAKGRVSLQAWNDTFRSVTTFLFQLGLVLIGWRVAGMVVGWTISTVLALPITYYYLRTIPAVPTFTSIRPILSFAKYSSVTAIFGKAYSRYDILILGLIVGPQAAGYYEAALKLSIPATFVTTIAGSGLMAKVSNRYSKNQSFHRTVSRTLSYSSILAIPMFFGGLVVSQKLVVAAYGPEYRTAAILLVGLLFYQVVRTQARILTQTLSGMDKPDLIMRITGATVIINIILGYILLLNIGLIGVVIGTIIAELTRYALNAVFVQRAVPEIKVIPQQIQYQVMSAAIMSASVYILVGLISINSFLILGGIVGIGAIVYILTLFALSENFRDVCFRAMSNFVDWKRFDLEA